jgi:hypothetical protein
MQGNARAGKWDSMNRLAGAVNGTIPVPAQPVEAVKVVIQRVDAAIQTRGILRIG